MPVFVKKNPSIFIMWMVNLPAFVNPSWVSLSIGHFTKLCVKENGDKKIEPQQCSLKKSIRLCNWGWYWNIWYFLLQYCFLLLCERLCVCVCLFVNSETAATCSSVVLAWRSSLRRSISWRSASSFDADPETCGARGLREQTTTVSHPTKTNQRTIPGIQKKMDSSIAEESSAK